MLAMPPRHSSLRGSSRGPDMPSRSQLVPVTGVLAGVSIAAVPRGTGKQMKKAASEQTHLSASGFALVTPPPTSRTLNDDEELPEDVSRLLLVCRGSAVLPRGQLVSVTSALTGDTIAKAPRQQGRKLKQAVCTLESLNLSDFVLITPPPASRVLGDEEELPLDMHHVQLVRRPKDRFVAFPVLAHLCYCNHEEMVQAPPVLRAWETMTSDTACFEELLAEGRTGVHLKMHPGDDVGPFTFTHMDEFMGRVTSWANGRSLRDVCCVSKGTLPRSVRRRAHTSAYWEVYPTEGLHLEDIVLRYDLRTDLDLIDAVASRQELVESPALTLAVKKKLGVTAAELIEGNVPLSRTFLRTYGMPSLVELPLPIRDLMLPLIACIGEAEPHLDGAAARYRDRWSHLARKRKHAFLGDAFTTLSARFGVQATRASYEEGLEWYKTIGRASSSPQRPWPLVWRRRAAAESQEYVDGLLQQLDQAEAATHTGAAPSKKRKCPASAGSSTKRASRKSETAGAQKESDSERPAESET